MDIESRSDRLVPQQPLPTYSYVPGKHPHPLRDSKGHSYGMEIVVRQFDPSEWQNCEAYLFGIDLFNLGYYWEAHERWEAVWIALGRRGVLADFLKGLIKLAAAGVKAREGRANGVRRHAARAHELFAHVSSSHKTALGLEITQLIEFSHELQMNPDAVVNTTDNRVVQLWDFILSPVFK